LVTDTTRFLSSKHSNPPVLALARRESLHNGMRVERAGGGLAEACYVLADELMPKRGISHHMWTDVTCTGIQSFLGSGYHLSPSVFNGQR